MAGIQMAHIPYKGIAPAIAGQLANDVQSSFTPITVGMPHAKAGKLRAIGTGGLQRSAVLPDVLPPENVLGLADLLSFEYAPLVAPLLVRDPEVSSTDALCEPALSLYGTSLPGTNNRRCCL